MAAPSISFDALCRQIDNRQYSPVYLLHGEEGYYIDELIKRFEQILDEQDREFNLHVLYAPEVEPGAVMDLCMQYPMMADRQVVILKEGQSVTATELNKLARYVSSPAQTTVFVICVRGAQFKGKELLSAAGANGVVFESQKLKDYNAPAVIAEFIKNRGLRAEPKALEMLRDFVGTDLSRLYNEIGKLTTILGAGATVTAEAVERNVGVSKDYNNFELVDAIAAKNFKKVFTICAYFQANPKANPIVMITAAIFSFFADLMAAYYCPDKSDQGLKNELKIRYDAGLRRIRLGMSNYNAFQIIEIIAAIRRFDAMAKGVGSRQNGYALLQDFLYHILTAPGNIKF